MPEPAPPATPEVPATPEEIAAVEQAVVKIVKLLSDREIDAAASELEAAKGLAKGAETRERMKGVRLLVEGYKIFWDAVHDASKDLKGGDVLEVGSSIIAVVEVTPERMIIRVAGANRRYEKHRLPFALANMLARSWLDMSSPSSMIALGAFLLTEPNGDKEEVRKLWTEAGEKGFDTSSMMPLLEPQFLKSLE